MSITHLRFEENRKHKKDDKISEEIWIKKIGVHNA